MISEKMLEMLLLNAVLENSMPEDDILVSEYGVRYDAKAMSNRLKDLLIEFMEPYVIDNAPKGD